MNHQSLSDFIWSVADLLRGDYKQSEYGKVIFAIHCITPLGLCVGIHQESSAAVPVLPVRFEKIN